ncbi:MAG: hypothetical protein BJ554DRAFT_8223 [Olpidium bornovanus]|uniref:Retroviral polymerase SH3-like domain-containing protein n=1 Tax=Olpidium bornovanus TaxID=278681 RepID=A0A8H8DIG2_9FUNG|nr:MAG: hypothetical protein BJ554DRAFT_8223 [Olpidium bornovanus]
MSLLLSNSVAVTLNLLQFQQRIATQPYRNSATWNLLQNVTGRTLKIHRADRAGEYCSGPFDTELVDSGIIRQQTIRDTPEQNRVAKRLNRTLEESVQATLRETKLSSAGEKLILVGYSDTSKGYRLWNPVTDEILERYDVTVDESHHYDPADWPPSPVHGNRSPDLVDLDIPLDADKDDIYVVDRITDHRYDPHATDSDTTDLANSFALSTSVPDGTPRVSTDPQLFKKPSRALTARNGTMPCIKNWPLPNVMVSSDWFRNPLTSVQYAANGPTKQSFTQTGYLQRPGIDFEDTWSPVIAFTALRFLLAIAARHVYSRALPSAAPALCPPPCPRFVFRRAVLRRAAAIRQPFAAAAPPGGPRPQAALRCAAPSGSFRLAITPPLSVARAAPAPPGCPPPPRPPQRRPIRQLPPYRRARDKCPPPAAAPFPRRDPAAAFVFELVPAHRAFVFIRSIAFAVDDSR